MSVDKRNIKISNDHVITTPDIAIEPSEGLSSTLFTSMKKFKDKIAQIDTKTGQSDTFGALLQRCIRTALHMSKKNITRDHVITLCTTFHLNAIVPYVATQFLGAKISNGDPSFSRQEMKQLLEMVRPRMIFTIPEQVQIIETILDDSHLDSEIVVFGETDKQVPFSEFLKPLEEEESFEPVKIENLYDTAAIYFSSGTTGLPKGICLNHYSLLVNALNFNYTDNIDWERLQFTQKIASLPNTPLSYSPLNAISSGSVLISCILHGICLLICEKFDGKVAWDLLKKYKPTNLIVTPFEAAEILANEPKDADATSVTSIDVLGSAVNKKYCVKLQKAFPNADVNRAYGLTEFAGKVIAFKTFDKYHRELKKNPEKIESVGLPLRGISYKVVDTVTKQNVGFNEDGELLVKSKSVMNGYYNLDSSHAFDEEGWLKTGDIVHYDEDFCFYITDRIKETFKYQGRPIVPALIENELYAHPAVKLAAVIGIPRDDDTHPTGLVVLNDGFNVSEEEIEKFVEGRVTERQRLRAGVKFVKSLPLTVTGKISRKKLKEMSLRELNDL